MLYRRKTLRRWQYFSTTSWPGGLYASPTMAGSRSGGITASTWASLVAHGEEGYLDTTRRIMRAADTIKTGVARIPELRMAGNPTFCIAILSDVVDIYHVADHMASRGWRLNGLQRPPGFSVLPLLVETARRPLPPLPLTDSRPQVAKCPASIAAEV